MMSLFYLLFCSVLSFGQTTTSIGFWHKPPSPDNNTPIYSSFVAGTLRNNYTGWVGGVIRVGSNPITVTSLGRLFITGNSGTHTVALFLYTTGIVVPNGSVSINMTGGTNGQWKYATLTTPPTLNANTDYYIVSLETNGGDQWYDADAQITITADATHDGTVYGDGASSDWIPNINGSNFTYGPPNFKYHR